MVKFLLTLLVISFVLRYVMPVVLRLVVGSFVKKQTRRYEQQFGSSPFDPPSGRAHEPHSAGSGQVRVDYVPPKARTAKPQAPGEGEYIDFEEVK